MATIKDVAKKAGLSVSTVSRFLNNHPYISDEKKRKIEIAMQEMDYKPSAVAQQMRGFKTYRIGVLVSRITNHFIANLIDSIEVTGRKYGYSILIIQNHDGKDEEKNCLELLRKKIIDGLILCTIENDTKVVESYLKYGPILICNTYCKDTKIPSIRIDDKYATYEAVSYLISQGHKKIAYCTGGEFTDTSHGSQRNFGFKNAMKNFGLNIDNNFIYKFIHTFEDGQRVAMDLVNTEPSERPTAIFTGSDEVACGVVDCLMKNNVKVPNDIAVIGFDNQKMSSYMSVPITTVNQPVENLGQLTMEYLLSFIDGKSYEYDENKLSTQLIKREST